MKADEELLIATNKTIDSIHETLKKPWDFSATGTSGVFTRYRSPEGLTNFSQLIRNASFAQRLYRARSEISSAVISIQVLRGEITLTANKKDLSSDVLKGMETEHVSELVIRATTCLFNSLAYFFDFPVKDSSFNTEETVNYTFLRDPKLGKAIAALIQTDAFKLNLEIAEEISKGYFGAAKITSDEANPFTIEAAKVPTVDELANSAEQVLLALHKALEALLKAINDRYVSTLGYVSSDDLIVKNQTPTAFWKKADIKLEPNLFKIFNFWTNQDVLFETSTYLIKRNYLYKDSLARIYRSSDQLTHSITLSSSSSPKVEKKVDKAQEGEYVWTHTLEFRKPIKRNGYRKNRVEDACMLLTWITGNGVYSEDSSGGYSHKANGAISYAEIEYGLALKHATRRLNAAKKEDGAFYRFILAKYRQALQPASTEGKLIRIWEVLDLIADHYCTDNRKVLPSGYPTYEKMREEVEKGLKHLGDSLKVPLTGDDRFTPIMIDKSIGQKVREVLDRYEITQFIGVTDKDLRKRISYVYGVRSKLTHSAASRKNNGAFKEAINTYFFISEIVFLLLVKILDMPGAATLDKLKQSLGEFVDNQDFYLERSKKYERQAKGVEDAFKILAGEKPWPKGKKTLTL